MGLTESKIRASKPRSKRYRMSDGGGLVLDVTPAGKRVWRYRLQADGKDQVATLGEWPALSLVDARQAAMDIRKEGIAPKVVQQRQQEAAVTTFASMAEAFMEREKPHWAEGHYQRFKNRMELDVFPMLGNLHPRDIQPADVVRAVQPVVDRGAVDTALRVAGMIGQVLRYAVARGQADRDVTADLKGGLDRPPPVKHRPAVTDPAELGDLLRDIWDWAGTSYSKRVLQLAAYLFQRPGEICAMRWADLDLNKALWTYRVSKVDVDHSVPLPKQAVEILRTISTQNREYVFASEASTGHVTTIAPLKLLNNLGWKDLHTVHGFRATARTLIAEELGVDPRFVEQQLSHTVPEVHGRAYNRALYIRERTDMMQRYADYLDGLRNG